MGRYVARKTVQFITQQEKDVTKSKVLVLGATFKENVSDIRNSKVADVINEFKKYSVDVDVMDPYASSEELKEEYGFELIEKPKADYDAIIVAVNHTEYLSYDEKYFLSHLSPKGILIDLKGIYRGKIKQLKYWSL